jgi:S-DNA-T family DNA segregation ATPase FtsK/SpoIIIE
MAKKTKSKPRAKKTTDKDDQKKNYFWRQVFAFVLFVLAFFLLLGGFGWGGVLPIKLFGIASWGVGLIAYLLAFVLVYLGVHKFKNEEYIIPFVKLAASLVFLACLAGMMHVFVEKSEASLAASKGTYGGQVGYVLSKGLLMFLNSTTAFVIFLMVAWVSFMMMFGISPKAMFGWLAAPFKKKKDSDLSELKAKAEDQSFKVHEGVPIVHHTNKEEASQTGRLGALKTAASAKLSPNEDHAALTAESDPNWKLPNIDLLNQKQDKADPGNTKERAEIIKKTLAEFSIDVTMEGANVGPRVTQYILLPSPGQKLSKITTYENNMAFELAAKTIRIEAPIPGKRAVGIEVPNIASATVRLASILDSKEWADDKEPLIFAVGKDISGKAVIASIDKMPHLLIAGQTGSGKSVMINTLLTSLVFRNSPSDLKLILVDPKQVELSLYNDIPHLLTPVITEPEKCVSALKWSVAEMERRLKTFSENGKRNIGEYNKDNSEERMPYIVIVIDELYDLMMAAGRDIEALVARVAAKSRAAGIHLILATQRPSVDVITGLIKANVPSRIAFTVVSQIDSRTIIDGAGAEKLLGDGDMLYKAIDGKPIRLQGALIESAEIKKVNDYLRSQREPQYNDEVISMPVQLHGRGSNVVEYSEYGASDSMWDDAVRVVIESKKASTSLLQRRLRIGYGRASRIVDQMEERGIIGPADGSRPREVLVSSMDEVYSAEDESMEENEPLDSKEDYLTR